MEQPGYIYALINYSMPGIVKIGRTDRSPGSRMDELSSATGVPTPFVLVFDILVPNAAAAERSLHRALEARGFRTSASREFFGAPVHEVVKTMLQVRDAFESSELVRPAIIPGLEDPLEDAEGDEFFEERDALFGQAAELCLRHGQGSTSVLQRGLRIGYGRAARLIDQLHHEGVLGPPDGSRPRAVLMDAAQLSSVLDQL